MAFSKDAGSAIAAFKRQAVSRALRDRFFYFPRSAAVYVADERLERYAHCCNNNIVFFLCKIVQRRAGHA